MMKYLPILTIMLFVCFSCNGKQQSPAKEQKEKKPVFEMVIVPNVLTEPQTRADYLMEHYWDKFNFSDTTNLQHPEVIEQAFTNYLYTMANATPQNIESSIKGMLKKAEIEKSVYSYFTDLYEKYLYDPNAPMRNEEFYIYVLEAMINSPLLDDAEKIRPNHLWELAQKNRLGTKALDFTYTLPNGKKKTMYGIHTDYLILYFNNPDCSTCREVTDKMDRSSLINKLLQDKKLTILSVYPDEDRQQWIDHIPQMPGKWINGYDEGSVLRNDELYDLQAIPSLYLLDKNKTVLLKDAPYEQIEAFLYYNSRI